MFYWTDPNTPAHLVQKIQQTLGISHLAAQVLVNRGYRSPETAGRFWHRADPILPPETLPGLVDAVSTVRRWIREDAPICVYGDYDVDGTAGTAILVWALRKAGGRVAFYQPDRFTEGYGVHDQALERAYARGYRKFITVDTGIRDCEAVSRALQRGQEVVVLDHHEPSEILPPARVVVNPKIRERGYPFEGLCGGAIAYKFAQLLVGERADEFLEVAALATVADVMPLVGENRALVHQGLKVMQTPRRLGLSALKEVSGIAPDAVVSSRHVGFGLGPRLNALGRMGSARPGVLLLLTENEAEARVLALRADEANTTRKHMQERVVQAALEQMDAMAPEERDYFVVAAGEGWHSGVVGIAAAKVVEATHRPAILLSIHGPEAHGSARSVPGLNMCEALKSAAFLMTKWGGHAAAAGLTLPTANIPVLRRHLNAYVESHLGLDGLIPRLQLDAWVAPADLTVEAVEALEGFEPTGEGNPRPLVGISGVKVVDVRHVGGDRSTLKMAVADERGRMLDVVCFGYFRKRTDEPTVGERICLAGHLGINEWQGRRSVQLELVDWRED